MHKHQFFFQILAYPATAGPDNMRAPVSEFQPGKENDLFAVGIYGLMFVSDR